VVLRYCYLVSYTVQFKACVCLLGKLSGDCVTHVRNGHVGLRTLTFILCLTVLKYMPHIPDKCCLNTTVQITLTCMLFGHLRGFSVNFSCIYFVFLLVFWHMHLLQQTYTNNLGTLQHTQCQKIFADRFRCPTYVDYSYPTFYKLRTSL